MIPMTHPWTNWQEYVLNSEEGWRWKNNTPKKVIRQYEEWQKYYDKTMKIKI